MTKLLHKAAAVAVLLAASASAFAGATVSFVNIADMTDVPRHPKDRESMEYIFREHLNHLSERLPAGQELKVEFLDIDLAGDEFPRVPVRDIRVIKSQTDRMGMHFRYSIEQNGQVIRSGEAKLYDAAYTLNANHYDRDLYGFEKQMLDDWFRKDMLPQR
jgi:uncharacterized lipoprotein YbaY